jgi:hypothetical protein
MKIIQAPADRNSDQRQLDNLECSNMSHTNGPLLFGAGVAINRSRSAKLYAECMEAKGYKVERAGDSDADEKPAPTSPNVSGSVGSSKLSLAFPEGWQLQPLTDSMRQKDIAIFAKNITRDAGTLVSTRDAKLITDMDVYTQSRMAAQLNVLKQSAHSDVETITVNGHPARRFEVVGEATDGHRYKYLDTLIFGASDVVSVSTYTTEVNYPNQKSSFEILPERVAGIN